VWCPSPEYLILWLNVVLDIEVLLQSPVNKLSKQDLTSSVLVNLGKLSLQIIDGSNPLLQGGLHVLGGELLLVHPPVVPTVQPIKGLVVFEVLTESLQEETEFTELYEVRAVFIGSFGYIFNMMEAPVNCRDGIKELIDRNYITNSL